MPGVVAIFQKNLFYPRDEAYLEAVAEALRHEYEAVVAAGLKQVIAEAKARLDKEPGRAFLLAQAALALISAERGF